MLNSELPGMRQFAAVLFVSLPAVTATAQSNFSVDEAGLIRLEVTVETFSSSAEFSASGDLFAAGPSPYGFVLGNTPTKVTLASIPDLLLPAGTIPTEVTWKGSDGSLEVSFGAAPNQHDDCPALGLDGEFANLDFEVFCSGDALPGWTPGGDPFSVGQGTLAARTRQIVRYRGDAGGGGWGFIPSIDGFSLYIDAAFGNDVSIRQLGEIPRDARSFAITVNEHHNAFEVAIGGNALDLFETNREGDTVDYAGDVSALAGETLELQVTAKVIDENDPLVIPDGPDAGALRALVLDNLSFSSAAVPIDAPPLIVPTPSTADTDGDGLRDVIDVAGFDPNKSGQLVLINRGIEDLDGVSRLTKLGDLLLDSNRITSIDSGDFAGLTNLERLWLSTNQIESIERGDFDGLSNLQHLDMFDNRITVVERGDFAALTNVQQLELGSNRIAAVENGAFSELTELARLFLGFNQIATIEGGTFDGLTSLQNLVLQGNRIATLRSDALEGLTNLESLDLSENRMATIDSGAFSELANLQILVLARNNLAELNFAGATFEQLGTPKPFVDGNLFIDRSKIKSLILDNATLNRASFEEIVGEASSITDASLVGLTFSDSNPADLDRLFDIRSLTNVWVHEALFDLYAEGFNSFDSIDGKTVTITEVGDCNKDRALTAADLSCVYNTELRDIVLAQLESLPGDLDGNGDVSFADYLTLSNNFGGDLLGYADGNIDLQGEIDFADYLILAENFGLRDPVPVPEPDAIIVGLLGTICLTGCRRSRRGDHA